MGLAVSCIWVSNAIITFAFPPIMDIIGPTGTYLIFVVINIIAVTWMIKVVPETKIRSRNSRNNSRSSTPRLSPSSILSAAAPHRRARPLAFVLYHVPH